MSGRLVGMVLDHGPTQPHQRFMLAAIAEHANDDGHAWPSMTQLGNRCGVTDRTAQRTIHQLEKHGWIRVDRRIGLANRYTLNLHALRPTTPTSWVNGSNPRRPRHPTHDAHVVGPTTPTSSEPSRTVIEPPRSGVSPPPNGRRPTLTPEETHHRAQQARHQLTNRARPPPPPPPSSDPNPNGRKPP